LLSDELRELYQETILDHQKNPRNFRVLPDASHTAEGHNPLCGDRVTVYVNLTGCAGIAEADRVAASIVARVAGAESSKPRLMRGCETPGLRRLSPGTPCAISLLDPLLQIPIGSSYRATR